MKFIFDVVLNFNEKEVYEYYEWRFNDIIKNIKKIPLFRISNEDYNELKNNQFILDDNFLTTIMNCSEEVINRATKKMPYACIFTNTYDAFAVITNPKGAALMKGGMLLDELYEALDNAHDLKIENIQYKVVKTSNFNSDFTRRERDIVKILNEKLMKLYINQDSDKLKYLYYECFNTLSDNFEHIYKELQVFINKDWTNKHECIYNLVQLFYTKEVMSKNP